jgi:hypothetical protein
VRAQPPSPAARAGIAQSPPLLFRGVCVWLVCHAVHIRLNSSRRLYLPTVTPHVPLSPFFPPIPH